MESGAISDGQISASSQYSPNHAASRGRLNLKVDGSKQGAWAVAKGDANPWLQIDLLSQHTVTGVATQGRDGLYQQWVTEYKLQYSNDGVNFQYYKKSGDNADKVLHVYTKPLKISLKGHFFCR